MRHFSIARKDDYTCTLDHELLELYPRLRRFARALTRDSSEADDLCQVSFEKALRRGSQRRGDGRLDSWMFAIIRNCWIDELRVKHRWSDHFMSDEAAQAASTAVVGATTDVVVDISLRQAIDRLPLEQRELVALVWVEGLSYREASDVLGIPIGTLTSRLARARKRLIGVLEAT